MAKAHRAKGLLIIGVIIKSLVIEFTAYIPILFAAQGPDKTAKAPSVPAVVIKAQLGKYYELKKLDAKEAKKLLEIILQEDPQNIQANKEMGYVLLEENKLNEAKNYFNKVLKINPDDKVIVSQIRYIDARIHASIITATINAAANKSPTNAITVTAQNPMDKYFELKKSRPEEAFKLLKEILRDNPNNEMANAEMGYQLLNQKRTELALDYFKLVLKINPKNNVIREQIKSMQTTEQGTATGAVQQAKSMPQLPEDERLLNEYYNLRKTNPKRALQLLYKLVFRYPHKVVAQRELAYLLLKEKKLELALYRFYIIERLLPKDYEIKMQIGYILDNLGRKPQAYKYFSSATYTSDPELKLKANRAMTSLSGLQTKIISKPWFADVYYAPIYLSRFNLGIFPSQVRLGRTFGERSQGEVYAINRTTWDSKSGQRDQNQLPQIFEDNVSITALGIRYSPFQKLPNLRLYIEGGRAYDLIAREPNPNRRYRNDLRGGLLYGAIWGAPHDYVNTWTFPFKEVGNAYLDISYFSRYDDNIIGYGSIREGLRVLEFLTAELNIYLRGRGGLDKNKEFYNNFVEYGPGIEFIPNNRYNLSFRFEYLNGYYIKVNSPSPNPYGPRYHNKLTTAELYIYF
ncbi:Predicted methyltransferase (contains TPR repeat) [Legionella beliardensis]|uniref:Predicted methyltransferase (Contains TPR repeat) n=1 Tax=Legionella beliardensis TaxID=91822 RepID=A0A378HZN9_9GAMM|nr:tetratricopeptide repeat protein [Legionella beliardensis]STX28203.1 Predicted methyltransferase (contains TPR repeat) [Legionella beliardensis]